MVRYTGIETQITQKTQRGGRIFTLVHLPSAIICVFCGYLFHDIWVWFAGPNVLGSILGIDLGVLSVNNWIILMRNIIHLMIVLAGLVIGGSLILALVAKVRTAAIRIGCTNNLALLGRTLELHHEVMDCYPSATVQESNLPPEERLSWLVTIWPYIEAGPRLRVITTESWSSSSNYLPLVDFFSKTNEAAHPVGHIHLFQCPGNPQAPGFGDASVNHYLGVAGVGSDAASLPFGDPAIGFFGYDRVLKKSDIIDGTNNTIAVMETLRETGPWTAGGPATVRGLSDPTSTPYFGCDGQLTTKHRTVQALFADGKVRSIPENMSSRVLEALATIGGKEEVAPP